HLLDPHRRMLDHAGVVPDDLRRRAVVLHEDDLGRATGGGLQAQGAGTGEEDDDAGYGEAETHLHGGEEPLPGAVGGWAGARGRHPNPPGPGRAGDAAAPPLTARSRPGGPPSQASSRARRPTGPGPGATTGASSLRDSAVGSGSPVSTAWPTASS